MGLAIGQHVRHRFDRADHGRTIRDRVTFPDTQRLNRPVPRSGSRSWVSFRMWGGSTLRPMEHKGGRTRVHRVGHASGMQMTAATLLIGVALLSAAAVAACSGPSSGQQFSAVLQDSAEAPPLPVVLSDETGLVTGIESAPMDPRGDYGEPTVRADPTDPNAFIISWLGGACDNDASLTFKRAEGVNVLNVAVHGKFGFGCTAAGVYRDLRIVTSTPIPVDSIVAAGHT